MKCPHCTVAFHDNWSEGWITRSDRASWRYRIAFCPECKEIIIEIGPYDESWGSCNFEMIYPKGSNRGPVPPEVPKHIADDYTEACRVLPISPKASAALSRRCLQTILRAHGYRARDLAAEIDMLLAEPDPRKAIPETLRMTVDGVRNFGNFSAHPITDMTTLQIIDVEDHEAEWCLEVIEEMFEHFYVKPAAAMARKAALDIKLAAAGKPGSK